MGSGLPITLAVRRSRGLVIALSVAHVLTGASLWPTDFPLAMKFTLAAVLALSLTMAVRRSHWAAALTLNGDARLSLLRVDGRSLDCQVERATTVLPWLIVLRVRAAAKTEALVLPVDALGGQGHRQLRLWLRWNVNVEPV